MGWHQLKDRELTKRLQDSFEVLVTIDRGFEHEHNLLSRSSYDQEKSKSWTIEAPLPQKAISQA